jgi:hypothetical protein
MREFAPAAETPDIVKTVVKALTLSIELDASEWDAAIAKAVAGDPDAVASAQEAAAREIMKGEGMSLGVVAGAIACDAHRRGRNGGDSRRDIRAMIRDPRFRFEPKLDPHCTIEITGRPCFNFSINVKANGKWLAENNVTVFLNAPGEDKKTQERARGLWPEERKAKGRDLVEKNPDISGREFQRSLGGNAASTRALLRDLKDGERRKARLRATLARPPRPSRKS